MGSEVKFFHIFLERKIERYYWRLKVAKKLLLFAEAAFIIYCSFVIKPLLGQP